MEFNTQICTTKKQSERLLALGLKKETADMWITHGTTLIGEPPHISIDYAEMPSTISIMPDDIPAWSLHRLIKMFPQYIHFFDSGECQFRIVACNRLGYYSLEKEDDDRFSTCFYNKNIYENIVDCIKWLIGHGCFNKEYLEK